MTITAVSLDTLVVEKVTGGLSCTIGGQAEVVTGGSSAIEPFTAACKDAASGDSFSIQTASYQGGGPVSEAT